MPMDLKSPPAIWAGQLTHFTALFLTLFFLCSCSLSLGDTASSDFEKEKEKEKSIYETVEKDAVYRSSVTTGSFVELAHGPTYYEYEGETNAEIIVFIHGFSVPSYIWDPLYDAAIEKGYRVLRMDLYGRGHSVNPDVRYNVDLFATQIFELLTYLDIKNPINLVGLSMGGRVISQFAAVYPDLIKRLIYIGPSGFDVFKGTGYDDFDVTEEEVQAFIDADFSTRAESQLADFVRPGRFASWVGRFRPLLQAKGFGKALFSTIKNERSMEQENRIIGRLQFPVTFFWGELDTGIPLKNSKSQIEEWIPRAQLWVIPDSGHIPYMEQEEFFEYLFFEKAVSNF